MTSLTTEINNGNHLSNTDPATIFHIGDHYEMYTEQREFKGEYVSRYQIESGEWIIQLRNNESGEVSEIVTSKLTGWKKSIVN